MKTANTQNLRIQELCGIITDYDEALTMSARMAAATGDLRWEGRYRSFEPKLDSAIKEAMRIVPKAFGTDAAPHTDAANIRLVAIENQAFNLVRQGSQERALSLLASEEYEGQKRIYSEGIAQIVGAMRKEISSAFKTQNRLIHLALASIVVALPVSLFVWLGVLRLAQQYDTRQQLVNEALRESRDRLEQRVEERTAELDRVNKDLEAELAERRRAEETLSKSDEKYRLHFENVGDVIYTIDRELRVTSMSPSLERVLGYRPEEVIGRMIAELPVVAPEYLNQALSNTMRVFSGERTGPTEYQFIAKDGTRVYAEITSAPIIRDGKVIGGIDVARDITRRRQIEEQLRQAQQMEAIGQLAGGVAHDFNNLLTGIIGYTSFAMDRLGKDASVYPDLEEAKRCAEKAAVLVAGLLAFSQRHPLKLRCVNLNIVIQKMSGTLRHLVGERIELKTSFSEQPVLLDADGSQIEQVVKNICENARDAMPAGGILRIETRTVQADDAFCESRPHLSPGRYAVLSITDTGAGMDERTKQRIFAPFFTTKEVGKGTGLGLAMVYGIVRQHGGRIYVSSAVGKGTAFELFFAQAEEGAVQEKAAGIADRGTERIGNRTVLLAEDEEVVRKLGVSILTQEGYTVLAAHDGEEALRVFETNKERIDLVLLDMVMPKKGGFEVCKAIRALCPDMKALFLSGYSMDALTESFQIDATTQFLMKPFSPFELARKAAELLDEGHQDSRMTQS